MTQLLHLRRLVRSRLGVPPTDQMFTDDQLDDHINLAVETVEAEQRWPWQERVDTVTLTSDDPNIALPANWRATRGLYRAEDAIELSLASPSDILSWAVTSTAIGGLPQVWSPIGDRIVVRPQPVDPIDLTHHYYIQSVWLRADQDQPTIPNQFVGSIIAKAAELLATREDDRAAAAGHNLEYNDWIDRMRRDVRRSTGPVTPRVRAGSWLE